jgi:rod shape-determining protein MreC
MGVMTPDGVVGKVLAVFPDTSQVLLLNDKESGVGALLATSRTQAPVNGSGVPLLRMEYVSNDVKVQPGEPVLTSGQDRIFPKDLPVGTVVDVKSDHHSAFQQIAVQPAARLDQLEEVLVLLTRQDFASTKEVQTAPASAPSAAQPIAPPATQHAVPQVTGQPSSTTPLPASPAAGRPLVHR